MNYIIIWQKSAIKDIKKITLQQRKRIVSRITQLKSEPFINTKKLQSRKDLYRLRVGDYRVIFKILDNEIEIFYIRHRKKSYRDM